MAEYQYQGVDKAGKKVSGKIDAPSEGELRMILRGQGIRPIRLGKVGAFNQDLGKMFGGSGVSTEVMVHFTRQLQVLVGSGIPLVQGLEIMTEQAGSAALKNVIIGVKEKVSQGSFLWEAMSGYPKVFEKLYIALIRAGEASGSIDLMLKRLTRYLEDADRLKRTLKSAMMYPAIITVVATVVVIGMLYGVIPKFEEMLKGAKQELPAPTKLVIFLSHFVSNNIVAIILVIGVTSYLAVQYFRTKEGRRVKDQLLFHAPLFGDLIQKNGVARFCRTLQVLLGSGVNLIDAIDICKNTIDNAVLEEAVSKVRGEIETGKTLGSVVARLGVFPKMAIQMITVGESTGNLDKMLEKVADFYESEVEILVSGLTKMIEPLLMVFLGAIVGGMMIAMYLPVFTMAGAS